MTLLRVYRLKCAHDSSPQTFTGGGSLCKKQEPLIEQERFLFISEHIERQLPAIAIARIVLTSRGEIWENNISIAEQGKQRIRKHRKR